MASTQNRSAVNTAYAESLRLKAEFDRAEAAKEAVRLNGMGLRQSTVGAKLGMSTKAFKNAAQEKAEIKKKYLNALRKEQKERNTLKSTSANNYARYVNIMAALQEPSNTRRAEDSVRLGGRRSKKTRRSKTRGQRKTRGRR